MPTLQFKGKNAKGMAGKRRRKDWLVEYRGFGKHFWARVIQ
jgi:hypothetical protein